MTQRLTLALLLITLLHIIGVLALVPIEAQAPVQLRLTVVDADGLSMNQLTHEDLTLQDHGAELDVVSVEPASPTTQIVAIFEDLAVTQRQLNAAIGQFITSLDETSIVDMQSVDGDLADAIVTAINDLHARNAPRPVIVMMGQASEIAPSELPSSQVRGRRRAADLSGDVTGLASLLAGHGILFYGVSVTEVGLPNFQRLAASTGGRFEQLPDATQLNETLASIGRELSSQLLISYLPNDDSGTLPTVAINRPNMTIRAAHFEPTH